VAAKKRPSRAAKATRNKNKAKAPAKKAAPARKAAVTGQSLRLAAKQARLQVRRAGEAYVENATELEAARIKRAEAEQKLAAFYAAKAAREKRPFFNFLAQGDSWFDYTCGSAIIDRLRALFKPENAYFESIADSGRTLRQMLSRDFKDKLAAGPPNGARWSAILLSGGGNDICGDHRFRDWLKPSGGGAHPPDYYITPAFDHELGILQRIYEEAIALVGKATPGVRLFVHDYDFAIPDGRCVTGPSPHLRADFRFCFAGPWMRPAFEERGFHKPGDPVPQLTKDIVRVLLKRFADMLAGLAKKHPNQLVLVHTQGTLKPTQDAKLWVNELHPYNDSFALVAKPFYDKLRSLL
jgi:hypothetical protein